MNRSVKRPSQTSLVTSESINILGVFKAPAAIITILEWKCIVSPFESIPSTPLTILLLWRTFVTVMLDNISVLFPVSFISLIKSFASHLAPFVQPSMHNPQLSHLVKSINLGMGSIKYPNFSPLSTIILVAGPIISAGRDPTFNSLLASKISSKSSRSNPLNWAVALFL